MKQEVLHGVVKPADVQAVTDAASDPARAMIYMERLRQEVIQLTGAPDCVLVSTCTHALRVAIKMFVGNAKFDGRPVVVPDLTFIATAHAVMLNQMDVHLVDVDDATLHMSVPGAAGWPDSAAAVVPVELLGRPLSDSLVSALRQYQVDTDCGPIIVDAAQSVGATRWRDEYTAMCISFAANKIVHGHQGGAILARPDACTFIRQYLAQGRPAGSVEYHHEMCGENLPMNPLGAALAWSQLQRLPEIVARRYRQRAHYLADGVLRDFDPYGNGWIHVGYRDRVKSLNYCNLWEPMHMAPHLDCGREFPVAMNAWRDLVVLPSSDDLEVGA